MAEKRGNAMRQKVLPESDQELRRIATNPKFNAWVAANAGSGKTTILRDRVLRLLLAGVSPDHILCITFTKAAAAEMQDRIFKALAEWVGLEDAALHIALAKLSGEDAAAVLPKTVQYARSLFARAVETPGGLKIQTIHAFAERLLHLFPLEAKVPVDFAVLEPSEALALNQQARQEALYAASMEQNVILARAFDTIVAATGLSGFSEATRQAIDALSRQANLTGDDPLFTMEAAYYAAAFGLEGDETEVGLMKALLAAGPSDAARKAMAGEMLSVAKTKTARETANVLSDFSSDKEDSARINALLKLYLTQKMQPKAEKNFVTKEITENLPSIRLTLLAEQERVVEFIEKRKALNAFIRSRALLVFAADVLTRYTRAKAARNALDFDDLIAKLRLMLLKGSAAWVRMKLDGAIDHILVDEAQDTNPEMWDIIKALADDFFSGEGQRPRNRTLFVVGDEKQSIYYFQGAQIAEFEHVREAFAQQVQNVLTHRHDNHIATPIPLRYSFRSSPDILRSVDAIFGSAERAEGVTVTGEPLEHLAAHENFPGLIELWPLETREEREEPEDPHAPVDAPTANDPAYKLATRIANQIHHWFETAERFAEDGTRIRPGDILILVRERGAFFRAILRALKMKGIPVAGADRLKLSDEIAIDDLIIIAKAALLPQDDLALATALKTPMFGFDDAALEAFALRADDVSLMEAIAQTPLYTALHTYWQHLQAQAKTSSPFAFFAALLTAPSFVNPQKTGRSMMLTRLGRDVAEALDAFMGECYAWGLANPSSLLAFLSQREGQNQEIKRDMAAKANEVRVMTVHGAKGLEGRIVILADTTSTPQKRKEDAAFLLGEDENTLLVWAGSKAEEPAVMKAAREKARARIMAEYRRLLYVALTRAEDRLYITGYATKSFKSEADEKPITLESPWYRLVQQGLSEAMRVPDPLEHGRFLWRIIPHNKPAPNHEAGEGSGRETHKISPAWFTQPALPEANPLPPLRPSRISVLPEASRGMGDEAMRLSGGIPARRRGILIHQLYERLPQVEAEKRESIGMGLLHVLAPETSREEKRALLHPILEFLATHHGQEIFGASSRAELALVGDVLLPDGSRRAVSARIDRLIKREGQIEIVDIKTGQPRALAKAGDVLRQMALYQALVQQIFPDKSVVASIFWSEAAQVEHIPDALLAAALEALVASPLTPA